MLKQQPSEEGHVQDVSIIAKPTATFSLFGKINHEISDSEKSHVDHHRKRASRQKFDITDAVRISDKM